MKRTIERVWLHKDLICVVIQNDLEIQSDFMSPTWRCGYVIVPDTHPLYHVGYSYIKTDDVHGGLTYAGNELAEEVDEKITTPRWWLGFDCNHYGDTPEQWPLERVAKMTEELAEYFASYKTKEQVDRILYRD